LRLLMPAMLLVPIAIREIFGGKKIGILNALIE
jgi:hypothetical protein